jgi:carbamoyltransferase
VLVLGITGGHDANWCVVRDGVVLGAFEKERFSRQRHARGEVVSLIAPALQRLGLTIADVDIVATSEPVHRGTEPGIRRLAGRTYTHINTWEHQTVEVLGRILPCVSVPHHLAHAAYARYTSPSAEPSTVITWDGGGDFYTEDAYTSTSVSLWKGDRLEWIERVPNSDWGSLWFTYSRAVFGDPETAGKLMGLAAFGTDRLDEQFIDRFTVPQDEVFRGAVTVKNCWPEYEHPPFVPSLPLGWEDPQAKDIAHAVQAATVRAGVSLARTARQVTGAPRLAMAGGVALNGYLTTAIRRDGAYDDVWVPPAVDDGGLSAGCALFVSHHVLDAPFRPDPAADHAKLGMWYDPDRVQSVLDRARGVRYEPVGLDDAVTHAADRLAAGQAIAWVSGRAEHGPRALGSRSILSPASSDEHRKYLNAEVKFRESFRPVAPVVPQSVADRYFDIDFSSPYMMYIVGCTDLARREIPAAVHVDGTARVQTVADGDPLGRIAHAAAGRGEPPVLINTSFNIGEPIVNSPEQAVDTFLRSPLESMYLDGNVVFRD